MAINTLYDYYTSQGKTLPTVQERTGIAGTAGIQNYTGTADQNNQLLKYLSSNQSAVGPSTAVQSPATQSPAAQQYMQSQAQPQTPQAPTAPTQPSAKDAYINAYKAYIDGQKQNEDVTNAKTAYNDYMANITKSVAGKEGRGLGIPLQIVRGEQERLLKQTQPEAQRLQNQIGIAQQGFDSRLNGLKLGVDLQEKLMELDQKEQAAKTAQEKEMYQRERDRLVEQRLANPAFELSAGQSRYQLDPATGKYSVVASVAPKPTTTPTGTTKQRTADAISNYASAFVAGAKLPDGTAVVDQNGFITPVAWKAAISDAVADKDNPLTRDEFIKAFGHLLFGVNGLVDPKYGLTTKEMKLISG